MCKTLHHLYNDWDADPDVHAILVKGAGGKAFCAGGDVKGMVQYILAGQHDKAIRYGVQTGQAYCTMPLSFGDASTILCPER